MDQQSNCFKITDCRLASGWWLHHVWNILLLLWCCINLGSSLCRERSQLKAFQWIVARIRLSDLSSSRSGKLKHASKPTVALVPLHTRRVARTTSLASAKFSCSQTWMNNTIEFWRANSSRHTLFKRNLTKTNHLIFFIVTNNNSNNNSNNSNNKNDCNMTILTPRRARSSGTDRLLQGNMSPASCQDSFSAHEDVNKMEEKKIMDEGDILSFQRESVISNKRPASSDKWRNMISKGTNRWIRMEKALRKMLLFIIITILLVSALFCWHSIFMRDIWTLKYY